MIGAAVPVQYVPQHRGAAVGRRAVLGHRLRLVIAGIGLVVVLAVLLLVHAHAVLVQRQHQRVVGHAGLLKALGGLVILYRLFGAGAEGAVGLVVQQAGLLQQPLQIAHLLAVVAAPDLGKRRGGQQAQRQREQQSDLFQSKHPI